MESKRVFFVAHVEDVEATFDFHGLPCPLTFGCKLRHPEGRKSWPFNAATGKRTGFAWGFFSSRPG